MNYCQACGAGNEANARFCEKCGAPLAVAPASAVPAPPPPVPVAKTGVKAGPIVAITGVLVLLLALAGVGYTVLGPMSEDEYEDAAEDCVNDLYEAQAEIDGAFYTMYYDMYALETDPDAPYTDDELERSEADDARDAYDDNAPVIEEALKELKRLRPPRKYKDEHEALVAWAEFLNGDWLAAYEELLVDVEDDMTYADFSEDYDDMTGSLNDDGEDAWEDYWDAAEELNID